MTDEKLSICGMKNRDHWEGIYKLRWKHPKTRLGKFIWQVYIGTCYRYPPCCSMRFAWDYAFTQNYSGSMRGGIHRRWANDGGPHVWVPCGIFHHPDPDFAANR